MTLKIGLSTSSIEPIRHGGLMDGIGHYTRQIYTGLLSKNYKIQGFAFPRFLNKSVQFEFSTSVGCSYPEKILYSHFCDKPFKTGMDIFHSTDFKAIPMDCPVVATIWDALPFVHPEWFSGLFRKKIAPLFFRQSAHYADRIIVASQHTAKDLIQYFRLREELIRIIPCALDRAWLNQGSFAEIEATKLRYGLRSPYFLTVGTLQPRKNFSRLIDAFMMIPLRYRQEMKLVIVGKPGWLYQDILDKINHHAKEVIHLAKVDSDTELRLLYQGAQAFVFPSLYEGFGLPILEAFASKVPVIASDNTSIPEVCGEAALMVDSHSVKALSQAMESLIRDNSLSQSLVKKGWERVKLFNEEEMFEKTIAVYKELI